MDRICEREKLYLIPAPKKIQMVEGEFCMPYTGRIAADPSCDRQVLEFAGILKDAILEQAGFSYSISPETERGTAVLIQDSALGEQEYRLEILKEQIRITGGSPSAVLYGIQTLRQILSQRGGCLPCLEIRDCPDLEHRGLYHDVGRGRIPKLSWLKELADTLSCYKINELQLYVEHSYLFPANSEVWRDDTPLTAEDILELDQYCLSRGIELVPSLSSFGHLYKLLSSKTYRHLCEMENAGEDPFSFIGRMEHHTIDVTNPESLSKVKEMIREFMGLFTSRKFNICADETFDLGKGRNRARAEKEGTARMYMDYVKALCEFLVSKGRTPMLWGDVMLAFPELVKELPKGSICLNWGYAPTQTEDSTRTYAQVGVNQYVCPGVSGWNQFINLQEASYQNISRMCGYGKKYGCKGMLNTDWGDFGHINHPDFGIPGMIYGAAASWNVEGLPSYEELNRQISLLEFGDHSEKITGLTGTLAVQDSFGWRSAVYYKERWGQLPREDCLKVLLEETPDIRKAQEKNQQIRQCVRELTRCTAAVDPHMRRRIQPYLLAAEGMEIFNHIGSIVLEQAEGGESWENREEERSPEKLAAALENWYYQYRLLWHTVSRESELYRIGEVIYWYADYLRDLGER